MNVGERPGDSLERQPAGDFGVLEHVVDVIEVDELVVKRLAEDQPGNCGEENANPEDQPAVLRTSCPTLGGKRSGFPGDGSVPRFSAHFRLRRRRARRGCKPHNKAVELCGTQMFSVAQIILSRGARNFRAPNRDSQTNAARNNLCRDE